MVDLHHDIQFFLLCILALVFYMFFQVGAQQRVHGQAMGMQGVCKL